FYFLLETLSIGRISVYLQDFHIPGLFSAKAEEIQKGLICVNQNALPSGYVHCVYGFLEECTVLFLAFTKGLLRRLPILHISRDRQDVRLTTEDYNAGRHKPSPYPAIFLEELSFKVPH